MPLPMQRMSAEVAKQLRKNNLAGKTIKIKLRWPDFTTLTRQTTLQCPTDQEDEIAEAALNLLKAVRKPNQAVRLLGVGVSGLGAPVRQLGLWDVESEKSRKLQEAVDVLQEKYGRDVIHLSKMEPTLEMVFIHHVGRGLTDESRGAGEQA